MKLRQIILTSFALALFAVSFSACEKQDYQNPFHRANQNDK
ncbi:MAG: hypothetical protein ACLFQJ_10545 [Campylobacterales bacterium]